MALFKRKGKYVAATTLTSWMEDIINVGMGANIVIANEAHVHVDALPIYIMNIRVHEDNARFQWTFYVTCTGGYSFSYMLDKSKIVNNLQIICNAFFDYCCRQLHNANIMFIEERQKPPTLDTLKEGAVEGTEERLNELLKEETITSHKRNRTTSKRKVMIYTASQNLSNGANVVVERDNQFVRQRRLGERWDGITRHAAQANESVAVDLFDNDNEFDDLGRRIERRLETPLGFIESINRDTGMAVVRLGGIASTSIDFMTDSIYPPRIEDKIYEVKPLRRGEQNHIEHAMANLKQSAIQGGGARWNEILTTEGAEEKMLRKGHTKGR